MPRVLLAEDHGPLRELVCEALREEGFEVDMATDGEAALDQARRESYDALLLDDEMPRLRGCEVLRLLRLEGRDVAAVLVSGALELSQEECERLGVGPVLRKPLSLPHLASVLREAIVTWRSKRGGARGGVGRSGERG